MWSHPLEFNSFANPFPETLNLLLTLLLGSKWAQTIFSLALWAVPQITFKSSQTGNILVHCGEKNNILISKLGNRGNWDMGRTALCLCLQFPFGNGHENSLNS